MRMWKQVLTLLEEGKKVAEIASITGTSISNISKHKQRLIKKGLYRSKDTGLQWTLDLDQATDFLIERLQKAKVAIELEKRIKLLEHENARLERALSDCKKTADKRLERERRYSQAVAIGDINKPILS